MARRTFRIAARRVFRISGQEPKVQWKRNKKRAKHSIERAEALARRYGVRIPDDVVFFVAEVGELEGTWDDLFTSRGMETARGPVLVEHADGYVYWQDHYNKFGKIPFLIHPDILTSDEAIIAVMQHEMSELAALREVFFSSPRRRMNATDYGLQVATGSIGNFHDQAWDAADTAVLRMRKAKRS